MASPASPSLMKRTEHFGTQTLSDLNNTFFSRRNMTRGSAEVWDRRKTVIAKAVIAALPSAMLATGIKYVLDTERFEGFQIIRDVAAWSGFSMLVTFLVVFRTSQSYTRFWEGCTSCHRMRAEWFDACSALIAFCRGSTASEAAVNDFQQTLVRLFSLLHGMALAEVEDRNDVERRTLDNIEAYSFELLDPGAFDKRSMRTLLRAKHKPELLYSWLQALIVDNVRIGVLQSPPPLLTRAFQELTNGMVAFHEAQKISSIPLPAPYVQACDAMLVLHWIFTPLVIPQFVVEPGWAFAFAFIQVLVLWGLNFTAKEIENPFGRDANDMDRRQMQKEMNSCLQALLEPNNCQLPRINCKKINWKTESRLSLVNVISSMGSGLSDATDSMPISEPSDSFELEGVPEVSTIASSEAAQAGQIPQTKAAVGMPHDGVSDGAVIRAEPPFATSEPLTPKDREAAGSLGGSGSPRILSGPVTNGVIPTQRMVATLGEASGGRTSSTQARVHAAPQAAFTDSSGKHGAQAAIQFEAYV